jgi:hypothetical protein
VRRGLYRRDRLDPLARAGDVGGRDGGGEERHVRADRRQVGELDSRRRVGASGEGATQSPGSSGIRGAATQAGRDRDALLEL